MDLKEIGEDPEETIKFLNIETELDNLNTISPYHTNTSCGDRLTNCSNINVAYSKLFTIKDTDTESTKLIKFCRLMKCIILRLRVNCLYYIHLEINDIHNISTIKKHINPIKVLISIFNDYLIKTFTSENTSPNVIHYINNDLIKNFIKEYIYIITDLDISTEFNSLKLFNSNTKSVFDIINDYYNLFCLVVYDSIPEGTISHKCKRDIVYNLKKSHYFNSFYKYENYLIYLHNLFMMYFYINIAQYINGRKYDSDDYLEESITNVFFSLYKPNKLSTYYDLNKKLNYYFSEIKRFYLGTNVYLHISNSYYIKL